MNDRGIVYKTGEGTVRELDPSVQEQVRKKLEQCEEFPEHHLSAMKGRDDYKLRAGHYRALIQWNRDEDELYVKSVGHRRNFYDRL